jgi:hypothetical protein
MTGPRIHAVIFCWPGHVEKARAILAGVEKAAERVTVVDSSEEPAPEDSRWVRLPRDHFYGRLFARALTLFDGDVLLQIQADASTDDWPRLVNTCRTRHATPTIGVWSPEIDHTWWPTSRVQLFDWAGAGLTGVVQTDGIVSSMTAPVVNFLSSLDYEQNNLGWGIDWAAAGYAYSAGLYVVRDRAVIVRHPKGSGYRHDEARKGMEDFLTQLPHRIQIQCMLLYRVVLLADAQLRAAELEAAAKQ